MTSEPDTVASAPKVTTRRTSEYGDLGAYDVYVDGLRVGHVAKDITGTWNGWVLGSYIAAEARKRDAVAAVVSYAMKQGIR
jgi:hypothetical protein